MPDISSLPAAVDLHSHVIPPAFIADIGKVAARVETRAGAPWIVHEQGYAYPMLPEFSDVGAKLAAMDRKGIGVSVLSPAPPTFTYWAERDLAGAVTRAVNDGVAAMIAARPDRLRGIGILPMQHPEDAVAELERIVAEHGFRGVEIGTSIEGARLSEPRFRPVLRRAAALGVFVFAHPYYIGNKSGFEDYYLTNLIGNPLETAMMVADLMFSGTLDELPELKLVLAHGGGFAPYQIGRLVHGHAVRSETRANTARSPLELLRRLYFDTIVFEPQALRFLVDLVGADHVALGTDAPFDMGDETPLDTLAAADLGAARQQQVAARTALALLGEPAR